MLGFLHLGNHLDLSIAELSHYVHMDKLQLKDNFYSFNDSKFFDLPYDNLGGVRAVYKIIANTEDQLLDYFYELADSELNHNVYVDSNFLKPHILRKIFADIDDLKIKYTFKSTDYRPNRFAASKDRFVYILKFKNKTYYLEATFIANAKKYAVRDYKKPYRDPKLGMLPPKLSQMMLNMCEKKDVVYDPFCGTGSVLMEAVLSGSKKVYASDLVEENIDGSAKNLFFMQRKFALSFDSDCFVQDVRKPFVKNFSFDSIVSEGYLGKPLHGNEPTNFLRAQMHTVFELYLEFFRHLANFANNDFELVMCYPIFPMIAEDSEESFYNLLGKISEYGFEKESLSYDPKIKTALYKRDNQFVHRLVFKLNFIKS